MKAYKLEILIIDHDELGPDEIVSEIERANYANDCISPDVKSIIGVDIGEWDDDHPLNKRDLCEEYYNRFFGAK